MLNQIEEDNNNKYNRCCGFNMPCAKFLVASCVSVGTCIYGCTMLVVSKDASLMPFFAGLVSASITYWCQPPSMKDK